MKKFLVSSLFLLTLLYACGDDDNDGGVVEPTDGIDLTNIEYNPTPHVLEIPPGFPPMIIPADNPLTAEGIELGRMLFYDPILSIDSTISCASCHAIKGAFSDDLSVSVGVNGLTGTRSAMPLINIGFVDAGLFWDGRSPNLEDQALHPVENPVEMADTWENCEEKLRRHPDYPELFRKAFGIENSKEVTKDLATKAIAQFERTLISANSRFDQWKYQGNQDPFLFSDEESDGLLLYYDDAFGTAIGGHCAHCHDGGALLSSEKYENNGLQMVETLDDFADKGHGDVTGNPADNGKFRTVSLRNIALTAPYMHDGRLQTLREVVEHYNSGGHYAPNVNAGSITELNLSEEQIDQLVAFLHTFTDTSFYNNPAFQNPFE